MTGLRAYSLLGAAGGGLVALPALALAIASAGAGHGDYGMARMLFPIPMLLTVIGGKIGLVQAGAALGQWPLYGAILGRSLTQKSIVAPSILLLAHGVAVIACFSGVIQILS